MIVWFVIPLNLHCILI